MQPEPPTYGIAHVSLLAPDLERTVRFYVDMLGLSAVDRTPDAARTGGERVWLGNDRSRFVTVAQSPDETPGEAGIGAIHHIAFSVGSFDALLKWKRWLQDNQVLVYGPYDQQAYRNLVFADPDGVFLEIATTGPGFESIQDGSDLYAPPVESMAPFRDEALIASQTWQQPLTAIEPDMELQGLHHIASITSSLARTDAFYRDVLALSLVRKTINSNDPEVERWYWGLDGGRPGTLVVAFPIVHPGEGGKAVYGRIGPGVALHFALGVPGLDALRDRLSSSSPGEIRVTAAEDETGDPAVSIRDPDGQIIELIAT